MHKSISLILCFIFLYNICFAQDTLPNISVTKISKKVLVSWSNPFSNVANINIQRSYDSLKYFTTIGSVLNVRAGSNGYVDAKEFIPDQYYRVFISFEGGTYIFTKSHRPVVDTSRTIEEMAASHEVLAPPAQTWFVPSRRVYTGKENNVIIALPDAEKKKYSVKFFEDDGTILFEIKKIIEPYLIVDKVNFLHAGLFNFELYADGTLVERHKFYIPKDGQQMPSMDAKGNLLK